MLNDYGYNDVVSISRQSSSEWQPILHKNAPANELYRMVQDIVWSARRARAIKEGKTLECVVREEIRHAISLGAPIDLELEVKRAMAEQKARH